MPDVATIESRRRVVDNGKAGLPAIILLRAGEAPNVAACKSKHIHQYFACEVYIPANISDQNVLAKDKIHMNHSKLRQEHAFRHFFIGLSILIRSQRHLLVVWDVTNNEK